MNKLRLQLAIWMETKSNKIKRSVYRQTMREFLKKHSLQDGIVKPKKDVRYNPYEGTSLLLIDELIKSNEIKPNEKFVDIGCGAGIFMIYLAMNGFRRLKGFELDVDLYNICSKNIHTYLNETNEKPSELEVVHANAVESDMDDDASYFFLFNTFFDKETYCAWLNKVEESLHRNERKIKIIILYPTIASMGAMRERDWLRERGRVACKAQLCYRCVNFLIYESI